MSRFRLREIRAQNYRCFDELTPPFEEDTTVLFAENGGGKTADIARRAVMLNPFDGTEAPARVEGVVLIDAIDLHMHPGWQRVALPRLREAFPKPVLSEAPDWRRLDGMNPLERISLDPAVRFGKPCVRGTRITVGDVLGYLAGGTSEDQLLADFPQLSPEDVRACLAYAAERERRTVGVSAA